MTPKLPKLVDAISPGLKSFVVDSNFWTLYLYVLLNSRLNVWVCVLFSVNLVACVLTIFNLIYQLSWMLKLVDGKVTLRNMNWHKFIEEKWVKIERRCNSSNSLLTDIVIFGLSLKVFKTRLLGRGFHTFIKIFRFPL